MNKINKVKAIVWDLDGTLYYSPKSAEVIKKAFVKILASRNNLSYNDSLKTFNNNTNVSWSKLVSRETGLSEFDVLMSLESMVDRTKYVEKDLDLVDMVSSLSNYRHLILTNAAEKNAKNVLKKLGFKKGDSFEKIFSVDNTKTFKPNLAAFKKVLSYTKLPPDEHIMVGDFINADIVPAKKLGFVTCLVKSKSNEADFSLSSVHKIPRIFTFAGRFLNKLNF